jgi:hypothetical protein
MRRAGAVLIVGGVCAAGMEAVIATSSHTTDEFCTGAGVLVDGPQVEFGDITLYVDQPASNRDP